MSRLRCCLILLCFCYPGLACAALLDELNSGVAERERRAMMQVEELEHLPAAIIPSLFELWQQDDPYLRRASYRQLKQLAQDLEQDKYPSDSSHLTIFIDQLEKQLKNGDNIARHNSVALATELRKKAQPLYDELVDLLAQDSGALRVDVLRLFDTNRSTDDFLERAVKVGPRWAQSQNSDSQRAFHILLILMTSSGSRLGDEALPVLLLAINDREPINRRLAAQALSNFEKEKSIQALAAALNDPWVHVQFAARDSLSEIGLPALGEIRKQLSINDPDALLFAVESIGAIYERVNSGRWDDFPQDYSVDVDTLISIAGKSELPPAHRKAALLSLKNMAKYAAAAQPFLLEQIDQEAGLQEHTIDALNAIAVGLVRDEKTEESFTQKILTTLLPLYKAKIELDGYAYKATFIRGAGDIRNLLNERQMLPDLAEAYGRLLLSVLDQKRSSTETVALINALQDSSLYPEHFLPLLIKELDLAKGGERADIESAIANYTHDAYPYVFPLLESKSDDRLKSGILILRQVLSKGGEISGLVNIFPRLSQLAYESGLDTNSRNALIYVLARYHAHAPANTTPIYIDLALKPAHSLHVEALNQLSRSGSASAEYLGRLLNTPEALSAFNDSHARLVVAIASDLRREENVQYLSELNKLLEVFEEKDISPGMQATLAESVKVLQAYKAGQMHASLKNFIESYPLVAIAIPLALIWVLLVIAMFFLKPLALFRINESLGVLDFKLPSKFGGYSLPLRYLLLVGFFHHHPRVLDAWVALHVASVRERFFNKPTVRQRKVFVDLPLNVNGSALPALKGAQHKRLFERRLALMLLWGEGGSGKTSLACHLAKMALSTELEDRPSEHLMIPVLIEHESTLQIGGDNMLELAVSQQIQDLCDLSSAPNPALLKHLLAKKRILVIIDHLSEMSDAARDAIKSSLLRFPACALIVTTRLATDMDGFSKSVIRPMRIAGNRLSSFMEAYLSSRGARETFTDSEFFKSCSHLSDLVGEREITALFAKLYAEEMIAAKRQMKLDSLSTSVPDMILGYSNELNDALSEAAFSNREVHQIAKQVAWCCVRENLLPTQASLASLDEALGEAASEQLTYLSQRLKLIQLVEPAADAYRFMLDPVAEYFAAMHLCESLADDEHAWYSLLERIESRPFQQIRGFVYALDDCMSSLKQGESATARLKALLQASEIAA